MEFGAVAGLLGFGTGAKSRATGAKGRAGWLCLVSGWWHPPVSLGIPSRDRSVATGTAVLWRPRREIPWCCVLQKMEVGRVDGGLRWDNSHGGDNFHSVSCTQQSFRYNLRLQLLQTWWGKTHNKEIFFSKPKIYCSNISSCFWSLSAVLSPYSYRLAVSGSRTHTRNIC